jgi:hypothetical protein
MKRLLLVICAVSLLLTFGPVPSANAWWWHHHSKSSSNAAASDASPAPAKTPRWPRKSKTPKTHQDKNQSQTGGPLYSVPKSVGWWHKMPGPAGAGA